MKLSPLRLRRGLQLAALAVFSGLQLLGIYHSAYPHEIHHTTLPSPILRLFIWKMFAPHDQTNWRVDFEGGDGEVWQLLPMEEWVPKTPDSSYLWDKAMILRKPSFRTPFLRRACERSGAPMVRAVWRSWPKIPGQPVYTAEVTREKVLATMRCEEAS